MLTMPQEAFDRAIFNTKLSETVLGFSLVQTCFPPEPGINTQKVKGQFINLLTCLFVWTCGCSLVKAI